MLELQCGSEAPCRSQNLAISSFGLDSEIPYIQRNEKRHTNSPSGAHNTMWQMNEEKDDAFY